MCDHWLCNNGTHRRCYFSLSVPGYGPSGEDVNLKILAELDALREQVRRSDGQAKRAASSVLGEKIMHVLRNVQHKDERLANERAKNLEARYEDEPDPPSSVRLLAEHSAAEAATQVRRFGEAYAKALGEELRK